MHNGRIIISCKYAPWPYPTTTARYTPNLTRTGHADIPRSLTNYSQLLRQLPSPGNLAQIEEQKQKGNPRWKALLRKHSKGSLFKVDWHRVVLDEAHAISNRSSQSKK